MGYSCAFYIFQSDMGTALISRIRHCIACLLGAIQMMAARKGRKDAAKNAVVHTSVHLGEPNGIPGFGLAVDIKVEGVDEEILKAGDEVCSLVLISAAARKLILRITIELSL
jgi:organic hydroperoxide reductase OsmC/OhrA